MGIALIIALLILTSCKPAGLIYTQDGKIECGGDGKAIILTNIPAATDPTFDEMVAFIKADTTDTRDYIENGPNAYVCSDFAEDVHNNAEAAGIRAAWVGITFQGIDEGHAINAFETTDKGLVYIDCTNGKDFTHDAGEIQSWDTVAYLETGKMYGIINIDRVISSEYGFYRLQYSYYAEYEKKWQDYKKALELYNREVNRFNQEIKDKVFTIGSAEEQRVSKWKEQLKEQEESLESLEKETGNHWYQSEFSSYTVKTVTVHW
jgi:tetratricopeptide (TPR) repeat protein